LPASWDALSYNKEGVKVTSDVLMQQLANGISLGSLYALIAIGYTMVYGILRLINFAHGDIFMVALYIGYYGMTWGLPWYVAFVLTILLTGGLGMLIERTAYRPLRSAPRISLLISSIGVSFLLDNLAVLIFGGRPKSFPQIPFFTEMVDVAGIKIQRLSFLIPVITAVLLILLVAVINKSKSGLAMRAVSKDMETARLMGVDINKTISFTFAIGSMLAAVGAIMWGMKYPPINPYIGLLPGLKCFIAAVLGGIGNIKGAVLGGFLLGLVEVMIVALVPALSGYKDAIAFVVLILILLVKPTGLIGEKVIEKV